MSFKAPYIFKVNNREVVIQHKGGGSFEKYLRVNGDNAGPNGGTGKFARFIVELQGDGKIKLKSKESGKYLRIEPNASVGDENKIDIKGTGGKWTVFKVHKTDGGANQVKLESAEQPGKYLAVQKDNKIRIGNGGPWTVLRFFREGGGGDAGPFSKPYEFAKNNTVIIGHRGNADKKYQGKQIRVTDGNEAGSNGGKGKFAQMEATVEKDGGKIIVSFKAEGGGYLRIQPVKNVVNFGGKQGGPLTKFIVDKKGLENGGRVARLQSQKDPSKYVSVKANGDVNPGTGGIFTELVFFRKN